jgi:heat-inducible transcriptional repressor
VPSQLGYRHYVNCLLPAPGAAAGQLERELAGLSLQWAALDDLLLQLARRLADLTGLLSLITRPQRLQPQLQALRLVPSGDRLLVFLVESAAASSSLNLRLPAASRAELPALERWTTAQLEQEGNVGRIDWSTLPPHLRSSGSLLRQGLRSHRQARPQEQDGAVSLGLGGLLSQPEFSRSESLRPLLQLVEQDPQQLLQADGAGVIGGVWIGQEAGRQRAAGLHHCKDPFPRLRRACQQPPSLASRAAEFLSSALLREPSREWKLGPLGHALHALTIYQERVWGNVLPGGIAAYSGSMKAAPDTARTAARVDIDRSEVPDSLLR